MELKRIITDLLSKVFGLDFDQYLSNAGRILYGIRLIEDNNFNVFDCCQLFGPNNAELIAAIKRKGLINTKAGYLVNAGPIIGIPELKADLLFVSDTLLKADERTKYGQLFHELCHFIIDAGLQDLFGLDSNSYTQGKKIRKYTQYSGSYANDRWHTDKWFALLFVASKKLASEYPMLYESHKDAAQCSLAYDIFPADGPMDDIQWL